MIISAHSAFCQSASKPPRVLGNWTGTIICKDYDKPCKSGKLSCTVSYDSNNKAYKFSFYQPVNGKEKLWKEVQLYYDEPFNVATAYIENEGECKFFVNPTNMSGWLGTTKKTKLEFNFKKVSNTSTKRLRG